jgi:hypothetical protein
MNKKYLKIKNKIIFYMCILIVSSVYAGGPWTLPKGKGYVQISYTLIPTYNSLYGRNNKTIQLDRDVLDQTIVTYLEYGISNNFTGIIEIPVKKVLLKPKDNQNDFQPRKLTDIGNISLAAKYNFIKAKILISGQVKFDIRASNNSAEIAQGLRSGVDALGIIPYIHFGGSMHNFYYLFDMGIRLRNNDYSNELLFNSEVGFFMLKRFWVIGAFDIRESLNTGIHDKLPTQTG